MAVPRNRLSNAKKNLRRSHHRLKAKSMSLCPHCGGQRLSHRVCPHCGVYRGRQVFTTQTGSSEA